MARGPPRRELARRHVASCERSRTRRSPRRIGDCRACEVSACFQLTISDLVKFQLRCSFDCKLVGTSIQPRFCGEGATNLLSAIGANHHRAVRVFPFVRTTATFSEIRRNVIVSYGYLICADRDFAQVLALQEYASGPRQQNLFVSRCACSDASRLQSRGKGCGIQSA